MQGWGNPYSGSFAQQGVYGDPKPFGGLLPAAANYAAVPPALPEPTCASCHRPIGMQEIANSTIAPSCAQCQEKYDDGSYCRVCSKVWWPSENNMVGCDSCNFWIHDHCDVEAARILAHGAEDESYLCPLCRSAATAQAQLASLAAAEDALRVAQPHPPRDAFTIFAEHMQKRYPPQDLVLYGDAIGRMVNEGWQQLLHHEREHYEALSRQEQQQFEAATEQHEILRAKYLRLHNEIEQSGVQQQQYLNQQQQQRQAQAQAQRQEYLANQSQQPQNGHSHHHHHHHHHSRHQQQHQQQQYQQRYASSHSHSRQPTLPSLSQHRRKTASCRAIEASPDYDEFTEDELNDAEMYHRPHSSSAARRQLAAKKRAPPAPSAPPPAKRMQLPIDRGDVPESITVMCHDTTGTFYLRSSRVVCHCASCTQLPVADREMSATHFEAHSGAGTAKKWKTSLRIPAGSVQEVPAGGPNMPIGKWLVLWGIEEDKDAKSQARRSCGRAAARRGKKARTRHEWDSDATSSEDGAVAAVSDDEDADTYINEMERQLAAPQSAASGRGRGRGGRGRGARGRGGGRGRAGGGRGIIVPRAGRGPAPWGSLSADADDSGLDDEPEVCDGGEAEGNDEAYVPYSKPRIGRPPKNPGKEIVAQPALAPWLEIPSCRHTPVRVRWAGDRCSVCDSDVDYDFDQLVSCDACGITVHQSCYGVPEAPGTEDMWLCRACELKEEGMPPPQCCLCPVVGGALKPTTIKGLWAHAACMQWIPEVTVVDTRIMEPVDRIQSIQKERWELLCSICRQRCGAKVQCTTCYTAYHPLCGRMAGLFMDIQEGNPGKNSALPTVKLVSYCHKHCTARPELSGVRLEGDVAAEEAAEDNALAATNGLWNCQPFPLPPAAPLPTTEAGCARAQPVEVWQRASHGTGMGCSSTAGFWIPTTMPRPRPGALTAAGLHKAGRSRAGTGLGPTGKGGRLGTRTRDTSGTSGDFSCREEPAEVTLLGLPEGVPERLPVICNGKTGLFLVRTQRILYEGQQLSASRFEQAAGKGDAKKWKMSLSADLPNGPVTMMDWLDRQGLSRKLLTQLQDNAAAHSAYETYVRSVVSDVVAAVVDEVEEVLEPSAVRQREEVDDSAQAAQALIKQEDEQTKGDLPEPMLAVHSATRRSGRTSGPLRKSDGRFMSREEAAEYHSRVARGLPGTPTPEPEDNSAINPDGPNPLHGQTQPHGAHVADAPHGAASSAWSDVSHDSNSGVGQSDSGPRSEDEGLTPNAPRLLDEDEPTSRSPRISHEAKPDGGLPTTSPSPTLSDLARLFMSQTSATPNGPVDSRPGQQPVGGNAATLDQMGKPRAFPGAENGESANASSWQSASQKLTNHHQQHRKQLDDPKHPGTTTASGQARSAGSPPASPITKDELAAAAAELNAGGGLDGEVLGTLLAKLRRGNSAASVNGLASAAGLQSARESLKLHGGGDDDSNCFLEALWAAGALDEDSHPSDAAVPAALVEGKPPLVHDKNDRNGAGAARTGSQGRAPADARIPGNDQQGTLERRLTGVSDSGSVFSISKFQQSSRLNSFGLESLLARLGDGEDNQSRGSAADADNATPAETATSPHSWHNDKPTHTASAELPSEPQGDVDMPDADTGVPTSISLPHQQQPTAHACHPHGDKAAECRHASPVPAGLGAPGQPEPSRAGLQEAAATSAVHGAHGAVAAHGSGSDAVQLVERQTGGGGGECIVPQAATAAVESLQQPLGRAVWLWFPDDLEWYAARVVEHRPSDGHHRVVYFCDEEEEWLDLEAERQKGHLVWANARGEEGPADAGPQADDEAAAGHATVQAPPPPPQQTAARLAPQHPCLQAAAADEARAHIRQPTAMDPGPQAAVVKDEATLEGYARHVPDEAQLASGVHDVATLNPTPLKDEPGMTADNTASAAADGDGSKEVPEEVSMICGRAIGMLLLRRMLVRMADGREISPTEFEREGGRGSSKKWKATSRIDKGGGVPGVTMAEWLIQHGFDQPRPTGKTAAGSSVAQAAAVTALQARRRQGGSLRTGVSQPSTFTERPDRQIHREGCGCVICKQARRTGKSWAGMDGLSPLQGGASRTCPASQPRLAAPARRFLPPIRGANNGGGAQPRLGKRAYLQAMPHLPAGNRTTPIWQLPGGRAYTQEQWDKLHSSNGASGSADNGNGNGKGIGSSCIDSTAIIGDFGSKGDDAIAEGRADSGGEVDNTERHSNDGCSVDDSGIGSDSGVDDNGGNDSVVGIGGSNAKRNGGAGGEVDCRRLNMKERLAVCAATETDRLVFGKSGIHGWGMFAVRPMKQDEMVMEYRGVLLRKVVADRREVSYRAAGEDCYLFTLNDDFVIDATRAGTIARFTNHSCSPTLYVKYLEVDGKGRLVFFAKNDLRAGQELTYDYRFKAEDAASKVPCNCGAPTCRGTLN